jgi:hypothetical protein
MIFVGAVSLLGIVAEQISAKLLCLLFSEITYGSIVQEQSIIKDDE